VLLRTPQPTKIPHAQTGSSNARAGTAEPKPPARNATLGREVRGEERGGWPGCEELGGLREREGDEPRDERVVHHAAGHVPPPARLATGPASSSSISGGALSSGGTERWVRRIRVRREEATQSRRRGGKEGFRVPCAVGFSLFFPPLPLRGLWLALVKKKAVACKFCVRACRSVLRTSCSFLRRCRRCADVTAPPLLPRRSIDSTDANGVPYFICFFSVAFHFIRFDSAARACRFTLLQRHKLQSNRRLVPTPIMAAWLRACEYASGSLDPSRGICHNNTIDTSHYLLTRISSRNEVRRPIWWPEYGTNKESCVFTGATRQSSLTACSLSWQFPSTITVSRMMGSGLVHLVAGRYYVVLRWTRSYRVIILCRAGGCKWAIWVCTLLIFSSIWKQHVPMPHGSLRTAHGVPSWNFQPKPPVRTPPSNGKIQRVTQSIQNWICRTSTSGRTLNSSCCPI
jgi:hypothetical protein